MKSKSSFQQHGAVLAFTLVMLLLLTLVGVSMIQQNKQQLAMATNTRQQNQVFADVETNLSSAEPYIDSRRYKAGIVASRVCDKTPALMTEFDDATKLLPLAGSVQCDASNPTLPSEAVTSRVTEEYCYTAGGSILRCNHTADPNSLGCDKWDNTRTISCTGEIYTIETTVIYCATGTQRKIESKYAVDCSKGYS